MKIEKGKLYYNTQEGVVEMPMSDMEVDECVLTDKIAVHCPTKWDWDYVNKVKGWSWDYSECCSIRLLNDAGYRLPDVQEAERQGYHIITIDQFKEFYPPVVDQDEYSWVNNGLQNVPVKKTDIIVKSVIDKYQQRSEVGIKKYGTTLEDNKDGIEIFLTHLQEEMMDATLYIEKLKRKFATLKKHL